MMIVLLLHCRRNDLHGRKNEFFLREGSKGGKKLRTASTTWMAKEQKGNGVEVGGEGTEGGRLAHEGPIQLPSESIAGNHD